jgi:hypothetical protein
LETAASACSKEAAWNGPPTCAASFLCRRTGDKRTARAVPTDPERNGNYREKWLALCETIFVVQDFVVGGSEQPLKGCVDQRWVLQIEAKVSPPSQPSARSVPIGDDVLNADWIRCRMVRSHRSAVSLSLSVLGAIDVGRRVLKLPTFEACSTAIRRQDHSLARAGDH